MKKNESELKKSGWLDRYLEFRKKIPGGVESYAVLITIFLILMFIPGRLPLVEMFSNLVSVALIPAIPVLLILLILKKWKKAAFWAIPSIAFVCMFGGLFVPNLMPSHVCRPGLNPPCRHIRVMTWNVLAGAGFDRVKQIEVIRNSNADIVALQEVNDDVAALIGSQLDDLYPYRIVTPGGIRGSGILSKFPILNEEVFTLPPGWLNQSKVIVDVDGVPIKVFSAHPLPPTLRDGGFKSHAGPEMKDLLGLISPGEHVLLMGDFNVSDQSADYRILAGSGLKDTFREVGWGMGYTWPNEVPTLGKLIPLVRIDYIWHSENIEAEKAWVGRGALSDHLPLISEMVLEP